MKNLDSLCLKVQGNKLSLLDQTQLPHKEEWLCLNSPDEMVDAIKRLVVRGAPAIGVSAAVYLALYAQTTSDINDWKKVASALWDSRPTAVNLMNALNRMIFKVENPTAQDLEQTAEKIFDEDVLLCERMADHGAPLIESGDNILTHCNTGGLATVGRGTALGVIKRAWENGKKIHVYVDETRPLLQGGRLTTWELEKAGIPYTLIADNMAAMLMAKGKIQKVFLGADRVARNGDFANKIGTYNVAVLAKHHAIPFYPVAPHTTIDLDCLTGESIPIEERAEEEVRGASSHQVYWAPHQAKAFNPAFDMTPAGLVSGLVTDKGLFDQAQLMKEEHVR